jgi:hypothetical protein
VSAPTAEGQRQWILLALLGDDITAADAAERMSRVEKAEALGEPIPDVRSDRPGARAS